MAAVFPESTATIRMISLGELCTIVGGGTPKRSNLAYFGGGIPWATPTDVTALDDIYISSTKETITEEAVKRSSTKLLPIRSVLLTSRATIGFAVVSTTPICTNQGFANFICGPDILPEYLAYWLPTQKELMYREAGGTTFKEISKSALKKFCVPVPPLPVQHRIVNILKRADSIRRLRKLAQDTARQLIPALFIDMFGDPVANLNGWNIKPLNEVVDIGSGVTKGRKLDGLKTIELPYLAVSNVQDGYLNLSKVKSIRIKPTEIEKYQVIPGDFLMTEGGDPDKLGRGAIWNGEIDVCLHQNHIFKVRCNRERLLPEYLKSLVGSHYGKGYFLRVAKQTTGIASINKTQLGKFPVQLPPLELQNKFLRRVDDIQTIISQQEAAQAGAESSFQSLLHRAFSGKI